MWSGGRTQGTEPDDLYLELVERLEALDELLPRLEKGECEASSGRAPEVSIRELVQRRSRTALSCRIEARLLREACMRNDAELPPSQPCELFFEKPELLEHTLSFLHLPQQLSGAGQVCTAWYLASRMQTLWEMQLRRSDRLIGPGAEVLPLPHEEEWTLFETAARIERHGCRPLDEAVHAQSGTIDCHVDDLAAYQLTAEFSEATGQTKPLSEGGAGRFPRGGGSNVYLATHAAHGAVCIHALNAQHSRHFVAAQKEGRKMPLARSPHLQPLLQTITDESHNADSPWVYLVRSRPAPQPPAPPPRPFSSPSCPTLPVADRPAETTPQSPPRAGAASLRPLPRATPQAPTPRRQRRPRHLLPARPRPQGPPT
jgi:hypothetical protein